MLPNLLVCHLAVPPLTSSIAADFHVCHHQRRSAANGDLA